MDSDFLLGFVCGIGLTMVLMAVSLPAHKGDCDAFGMTKFSGQVYVCAIKR